MADSQGVITRLAAPAVVAAKLEAFEQLAPLLAALEAPQEERRIAAARLTYEIVCALMAAGPATRPLVTASALDAWAQFAEHLAGRAGNGSAARWLVWALWREAVA
jgi:hypothetical protein